MDDEPEELTERLSIALPMSLIKAIDDWRRQEPDLPTRAAAGRRIIRLFTAAANRQPAAEPSTDAAPTAKRKAAKP
jgi:hypothetical protein